MEKVGIMETIKLNGIKICDKDFTDIDFKQKIPSLTLANAALNIHLFFFPEDKCKTYEQIENIKKELNNIKSDLFLPLPNAANPNYINKYFVANFYSHDGFYADESKIYIKDLGDIQFAGNQFFTDAYDHSSRILQILRDNDIKNIEKGYYFLSIKIYDRVNFLFYPEITPDQYIKVYSDILCEVDLSHNM